MLTYGKRAMFPSKMSLSTGLYIRRVLVVSDGMFSHERVVFWNLNWLIDWSLKQLVVSFLSVSYTQLTPLSFVSLSFQRCSMNLSRDDDFALKTGAAQCWRQLEVKDSFLWITRPRGPSAPHLKDSLSYRSCGLRLSLSSSLSIHFFFKSSPPRMNVSFSGLRSHNNRRRVKERVLWQVCLTTGPSKECFWRCIRGSH